jgi:hypothetical protein
VYARVKRFSKSKTKKPKKVVAMLPKSIKKELGNSV